MRLLVALIVWAAAVVGALEISSVVADSIHNSPAGTSSGSGSAGGTFDASSVKATDADSLFRTANLSRALATVRAHLGVSAQLDNFALYPGYLDLTAIEAGREVDFYLAANGHYSLEDTGANPGGESLFGLAKVEADVPAALAQRIESAGHVPESQLEYMVLEIEPISNALRWLVFPLQGNGVEYFQAAGASGPLFEYRTDSSTGLQRVAE